MDIVITIPKTISWDQYSEELRRARDGETLNYGVSGYPKKANIGDRCYICYRGFLIGWMEITGFSDKKFRCTTTGKHYSGKFIERSGKFHHISAQRMDGFQGFRYIDRF